MTAVERGRLSSVERDQLAEEEAAIELGGRQINEALATIREQRLYRETHSTFEDYCQERWAMTRSTANRRIMAIEVATALEPMGAKVNSRQARALSGLNPDEQRETWTRAQEQSGSEQPTAEQIKNARKASGAGSVGAGPPPPNPGPAPDPEPFPEPSPEAKERDAAERDADTSRRVFSENLARSTFMLATFGTRVNAAKQAVADWEPSEDKYPGTTTAARMREAADYLYAVAEEWPA